jgi:TPR repeat protein
MVNLGMCFEGGIEVTKELSTAARWYRAAAEIGHERGMYLYGKCFRMGLRVSNNAKAAMRGNAAAMRALGDMYERGEGVPPNDKLAIQWYERAAEKKDPAGTTSLAIMVRDGRGTARNIDRAREFLTMAAAQGFQEARERLDALPRT